MEQREQTLRLIALAVVGVFGLLLFRLWSLQVIHAERYRVLAENNRVRSNPLSAPRGLLLDLRGVSLVRNAPFYHVVLERGERAASAEELRDMSRMLGRPAAFLEGLLGADSADGAQLIVEENIPFDSVVRIEAKRYEYPELEVRTELGRIYPYGDTGAHVLGYIGRLRLDQLDDPFFEGVPLNTQVGQWGVEKIFDRSLRGTPGKRIFEVNAMGRRTRILTVREPLRGENLTLSLDLRTQIAAELALGKRNGAVVALDPRTGEVLALVSHPSFDPNLFARGISAESWRELVEDPDHPLFNRALQSRYPPGSTFKMVVAAAALELGAVDPAEKVVCRGSIHLGEREFKCWEERGHGAIDMRRAIAESCDVYFYEIGRRVGIDAIARYARMLGLTGKPGLGIPREAAGLVPTADWKQTTLGEPWFPGDTVNASIGQGYVGVSPFLMALAYSSLAVGGPVPRPTLVAGTPSETLSDPALSPSTYAIIQEGLREAVSAARGTGKQAASPWFTAAGKTGTAQVVGYREGEGSRKRKEQDHAWFLGYAPAENPRIVVSVLVEHGGHGGSAAAPIARQVLESYLSPEGPRQREEEQ